MTQAASARPEPIGPAAALGIGAVRVYQWTLRPFIGANCRFWPSCSEYAVGALRYHGALRGAAMAAKRILRCNPWHEGGIDPVPLPAGATGEVSPVSVVEPNNATSAVCAESPACDPGAVSQVRH
jgi:putative membrane protein insertion efficiency factor